MSLSQSLAVKATISQQNANDLSLTKDDLVFPVAFALTDGTGADQANLCFHDKRTISASSSDDLDLAGGLTDAFGNVLTFARVKTLIVKADAANGDVIEVGGASANAFSTPFLAGDDRVVVRPGGILVLAVSDATAYPVTAGTADILSIHNADSGATADYEIVLVGADA